MKHQQVVVDYWAMFKTSFLCLFLAFSGYILIKMVQTIFWLPAHLKRNQQRLEQLAAHYSLEMNRGIEDAPHATAKDTAQRTATETEANANAETDTDTESKLKRDGKCVNAVDQESELTQLYADDHVETKKAK